MKTLIISMRFLVVLTVLTGVIYPLFVTLIGQAIWPHEAMGSLILRNGHVVGSELLAQKFTKENYFLSRPSGVDFATIPSGASNQSSTSQALAGAIKARRNSLGQNAPADLVTASASGLDPHLSVESVLYQLDLVAKARNLTEMQKESLKTLVESHTVYPSLGFIGERVVNVLSLNLDLDGKLP